MAPAGPLVPPVPPPPPSYPPEEPGADISKVDVSVSGRLLWVNMACYPLRSIARVRTHEVAPDRGKAFTRFLKWLGFVLVVLAVSNAFRDEGAAQTGVMLGVLVLGYAVVDLTVVLLGSSYSVLVVETTGLAKAVLVSKSGVVLAELVEKIAHAIENPEADFRMRIDSLTINHKNYDFGDKVNINGGTGNVGITK
ncbi:DUF6232 family protein [Streptomyces exfoliatus]|uniref:DUF6232 family protein n=1 Tax=Streptomyces TaxID=1883 RepID=UPI0004CA5649|nr:DUF6232 family protein [Streptomyces exfoliatus]